MAGVTRQDVASGLNQDITAGDSVVHTHDTGRGLLNVARPPINPEKLHDLRVPNPTLSAHGINSIPPFRSFEEQDQRASPTPTRFLDSRCMGLCLHGGVDLLLNYGADRNQGAWNVDARDVSGWLHHAVPSPASASVVRFNQYTASTQYARSRLPPPESSWVATTFCVHGGPISSQPSLPSSFK